jgi:hypothetical protein
LNWIVALVLVPVLAWGMWLFFVWAITRQHGVEALKAAPPIAKAFPVTQWVSGLKAIGPWVTSLLKPDPPSPPPVPPGEAPASETSL